MLKQISQRISRKRITVKQNERVAIPATEQKTSYINLQAGQVKEHGGEGPKSIFFSQATYQAHDPCRDRSILVVDTTSLRRHIFAAVITSRPNSHGGEYLYRNLHRELLTQLKTAADVPAAFSGSITALDTRFRSMHNFNGPVIEGVKLTVAYLDLDSTTLYLAGNGSCRCAVGRRPPGGDGVEVLAEVGREEPPAGHPPGSCRVTVLPLGERIDTIILGSSGVWHEAAADKALLRMAHYYRSAPQTSGGNGAMHLTQFALNAVTQRTKRQADPRMASLRSLTNLESLWTGSKDNFRWGGRQPLRRRRGDVHDDLTSIVICFDWEGKQVSFRSVPRLLGVPLLGLQKSNSSAALQAEQVSQRWALLRLHFIEFRREARRLVRRQWLETVAAALAQKAEADAKLRAAAALFRPVSLKRTLSGVNVRARSSFEDAPVPSLVVQVF